MKTLITKEIDGHTIALGFTRPTIDPVATIEIVRPILMETEEFKALGAKAAAVEAKRRQANDSFIEAAKALKAGQDAQRKRYELDTEEHRSNSDRLMLALVPLVDALEQRRRALTLEHAVYFEPRACEIQMSDEEAETLSAQLATLGEHERLTVEGVPVADFRGLTFWRKGPDGWDRSDVDKIGVDPIAWGGTLDADLTPADRAEISVQMNAERIAALSVADRGAEKTGNLDALASQAATKRAADEIRGVSAKAALDASRVWYEAEAAIIEAAYT